MPGYLRHLLKLHMGLSTSVAVDALYDSERRHVLHQASSPSATLITDYRPWYGDVSLFLTSNDS